MIIFVVEGTTYEVIEDILSSPPLKSSTQLLENLSEINKVSL